MGLEIPFHTGFHSSTWPLTYVVIIKWVDTDLWIYGKKIMLGHTLGYGEPYLKSRDFGIRQVVQKRGPEKQSLPFWKVLLYMTNSWVWDEIIIRQK